MIFAWENLAKCRRSMSALIRPSPEHNADVALRPQCLAMLNRLTRRPTRGNLTYKGKNFGAQEPRCYAACLRIAAIFRGRPSTRNDVAALRRALERNNTRFCSITTPYSFALAWSVDFGRRVGRLAGLDRGY